MKNAYLFGHTGSINRGCEAIVRSTADILEGAGFRDINLKVHNTDYDVKLGVDKRVHMIPYRQHGILTKAVCKLSWQYLHIMFPEIMRAGSDLEGITEHNVAFNIGGDTYCYTFPYKLISLNRAIANKRIPYVLWGCSVDERILKDQRLIDDMNRYSYIVTRETLSYELLKGALKDESKLLLACDPAFQLKAVHTTLPGNFEAKNTLGINVSPLFFKDYRDHNDLMRKNIRHLIGYILTETNLSICLVPHVYDAEKNLQDIAVLREIAAEYSNQSRIAIVDADLSCEQLKYIISQCRFFIGARTHSMIAAYSTAVPALALSYSIKSRGLAKDLYGDETLAIRYNEIKHEEDIKEAFMLLTQREEEIRERYTKNLEGYKKTICNAAAKIVASTGK